MKRYLGIILLALGITLGYMAAQQTRHEITKASPADKKGLSTSVPEVYAIPGQFQRIVVLRFKNQTDLLAGLTKMVTMTVPCGPASLRARSMRAVCPRWSAPIVGTRTTGPEAARRNRRAAAMVRRIFSGSKR